jgi:hypothetical protein
MIIGDSLPFIQDYVLALNDAIKQQYPDAALPTSSLFRYKRAWNPHKT